MLPDDVVELLTAFVDGELSQKERVTVMRLLEKSAEARGLLKEFQENAHKLKNLPERKLETSLVTDVLQAIAARQTQPKPATPAPVRRGSWMPFVVAALAASLLIGIVGLASWKVWFTEGQGKTDPPIVTIDGKKPQEKQKPDPIPTPRQQNPLVAQMVTEVARCFIAPVPKEQFFAARFNELSDAKGVKTDRLAMELSRAKKAVHLDVSVKNDSVAMDRLRMVLKYRGIAVLDTPAKKAPKGKKQPPIEYLVYADNLTPDEVTKVMSELGETFVVSQGNNQRNEPTPYKKLEVKPIAKEDSQSLIKYLGVDPLAIEPKAPEPGVKRDRVAVLIPITGGAPVPESTRQLLQRRKPERGTLQLVIRIRQD